jgi:hypothetical protein
VARIDALSDRVERLTATTVGKKRH